MITRETLRVLGKAIAKPFVIVRCMLMCRAVAAQYDPNTQHWKCGNCGCDWGASK